MELEGKKSSDRIAIATTSPSRKRFAPDDETGSDSFLTKVTKSRSSRPPRLFHEDTPEDRLGEDLYHNLFPTPPLTAPLNPPPTASTNTTTPLSLKLVIPQKELTRQQLATQKRHVSDAKRWAPKLQGPYPKPAEIKKAYSLKVMRHWYDGKVRGAPEVMIPIIPTSARVSDLLCRFPVPQNGVVKFDTREVPSESTWSPYEPLSLSKRASDLERARVSHKDLEENITKTETREAKQLAWECFAQPEDQGCEDNWREDMVNSGLPTDDLEAEAQGKLNDLPFWRKEKTSDFIDKAKMKPKLKDTAKFKVSGK